ncbi:MAG: glycosyltransferase family 4 protein [Anaerolineales bacterium]|nr:glycosyltransferase family 4 protein [Anaerolineales bacterium]
MRVVMVSKALVVGAYQRKAEELARLGVELTVFAPPVWRDRRGEQRLEYTHTQGYMLRELPMCFTGNYHLHYYPSLDRELAQLQPDVLHMDEEPYNLATWLGLRSAQRRQIAATFFTWQNLARNYPPPFAQLERANYRYAPLAIAGNQDAQTVLRHKGYTGEIAVIPQFGVDPEIFQPGGARTGSAQSTLRIGYAGGLVPEKGVDLLLQACAGLQGAWHLTLAGAGAEQGNLAELAGQLGIADHIRFAGRVTSSAMPAFYQGLDALVLPSRTLPNWKEQFGRVLIEAMACGVPVVGSDSGEVPHVIDKAGLVFPEGDVQALRGALQSLLESHGLQQQLGEAGRSRVLANYTMRQIAQQTLIVYEKLAGRQANRKNGQ